jgi:hypothetical protein
MKSNHTFILFVSLVIILIGFTQCTADKRVYTKGYHVFWHKNKSQNKTVTRHIETENKIDVTDFEVANSEIEESIVATLDNAYHPQSKKTTKQNRPLPNDSCGDVLTMKNGDEISGKVVEINQQTIKYKKCNNLNGPLFVVTAESVFMIKYANGTKEVIKQNDTNDKPTQQTETKQSTAKQNVEKQWNGCAIASLVCVGLFFLFFTLIAAAILSVIAENQFDKNPNKYKGKWMYIPGLVIAWIFSISITLGLIFLMLAIAL